MVRKNQSDYEYHPRAWETACYTAHRKGKQDFSIFLRANAETLKLVLLQIKLYLTRRPSTQFPIQVFFFFLMQQVLHGSDQMGQRQVWKRRVLCSEGNLVSLKPFAQKRQFQIVQPQTGS